MRPKFPIHTPRSLKAPPLRFKPGWYMRQKKTKQLYEIIWIVRFMDNPNEWVFCLEERTNLIRPQTVLSAYCEAHSSPPPSLVVKEPFKDGYAAHSYFANLYRHGDSIMVKNQRMLNEFEVISSGAIV